VVAEALTNALKHARASVIRAIVEQCGPTLHVEVSDDGVGGAHPGFGLTSVRDRVTSIGGELTLRSPAGAGTRIQVLLLSQHIETKALRTARRRGRFRLSPQGPGAARR
jgi:signal transduction histidine kinase